MAAEQRLFVKVTRDSLPQVKDKYPFLYLERGRLEIDDSSIKWIDAENNVVPLPVATLNALLLGPGTSITHEAVKTATAANCSVCWVGEDSLLFYAAGFIPTAVRGRMLWFIEPRPNVFVSGVKDSVATTVVEYLHTHCPIDSGLLMFRSTSTAPGFEMITLGSPRKPVITISGLQLIVETLKKG